MLRYSLWGFFVLSALNVKANSISPERLVHGRISDSSGSSVEYCTVSLRRLSDSTIVAGAVSDSTGIYRLSAAIRDECFLEFTHLGYETLRLELPVSRNDNAEIIRDAVLAARRNPIDEVSVIGRFIERKAGAYIVTLSGNPLAKDRFLTEALVLLPGIRREADNTFKINGRNIRTIYIDNRKASISELQALPAESVSSVEIQPNATSDQDVSSRGAVLKVTSRPLADGGYRGSIQTWAGMLGDRFSNTGFVSPISMRYGKFNFYNYLGYSYFDESHEYIKSSEYEDIEEIIHTDERQRIHHYTFSELFNIVYEAASRHRIGFIGRFSYASSLPKIFAQNYYYETKREQSPGYGYYESKGSLDSYVWQTAASYRYEMDDNGSELTVDLDYAAGSADKNYRYAAQPSGEPEAITAERMKPRSKLFEGKADLTKVFNDLITLDVGAEYYNRRLERTVRESGNGLTNRFQYDGQGIAVHSEGGFSWERLDLVAGLRLQWDRVDHLTSGDTGWRRKEYWRLCPNLSATFTIEKEKGTTFDVSYSRDDGYIPYDMLSPQKVRENEFRYNVGNPSLTPAKGSEIGATLTFRNKWLLAYNCSLGSHLIQTLTRIDPDDPRQTYTIPVNCASMTGHSLDLSFASGLTKWLRVNWSLSGAMTRHEYLDRIVRSKYLMLYLMNSIQFSEGFGMTLQFNAQSSNENIEYWHNATYALHASIYKYLFRKKLQVALNCINIAAKDNVVRSWNASETFSDYRRHLSHPAVTFSAVFLFNNYNGNRNAIRTDTIQDLENEYK